MSKVKFDGKGFSKEPLSPQELQEHRHRSMHYDDNFLDADALLAKTGLGWVANVARGTPAFLKAFAAIATIGGGIAALKLMGFL